ncbi:hypothetical protein CC2G_001619 [Coprinopsis cinerea AmutBmut pab1-1]|nr:hypothetical protein CC2G_001619 [Coprinopsis cinerea AmutBmut pab1-1]KAG2024019.1 hypothetical protein CC2G_001619 [Coprinopsis cinerea AmutBmut pab1-1]
MTSPANPNQRAGDSTVALTDHEPESQHDKAAPSGQDHEGKSEGTQGSERLDSKQPLDEKAESTVNADQGVPVNDDQDGEQLSSPSVASRRVHDILVLAGAMIMLAWPWLFWGAVYSVKGVKMRNKGAKLVDEFPQTTAFFVSLVGNFVCLVVDIFFSLSVIRFAQEWVARKPKVSVFHVSLLGAFRHQSFPWTMRDLKVLLQKSKWLPVVLVGVCIGAFQFVPSGTTSLLLPVKFPRTEPLVGSELDFSSITPECIAWLDANRFDNDCDWQLFNDVPYTSCFGQNQLLDVLAAGRSSVLALSPNNNESLSLNQIGAKDGMRLLGPLRGILPIGPNGAPAFDTLQDSPFANPDTAEAMFAYNYTLNYQGLSTNISCYFDSLSPIRARPASENNTHAVQYNATCPEDTDFFTDGGVIDVVVPNSRNRLMYWSCKAPDTDEGLPSYRMYLRGRGGYDEMIGNVTCDLSPVQPAIYPVTYNSDFHAFSSSPATSLASNAYTYLIENSLIQLSGIIAESQSYEANTVAEAVFTAGIKNFGLPIRTRDDGYLPIFEAMFQGMLDYEATYTRLVYSTAVDPPASCLRNVEGAVTYVVIGWYAKLEHIGFLMPMTLVNLASMCIIIAAIVMTRGSVPSHIVVDPTDPRPMLNAPQPEGEEGDDEWDRKVVFSPNTATQAAADRFHAPPTAGAAQEAFAELDLSQLSPL